jgi:hypothetical protein
MRKFETLVRSFLAQGLSEEEAELAARKKQIDNRLRHPDAKTNERGKWGRK